MTTSWYSIQSITMLPTFLLPYSTITAVDYIASLRVMVSSCSEGKCCAWDARQGKLIRTLDTYNQLLYRGALLYDPTKSNSLPGGYTPSIREPVLSLSISSTIGSIFTLTPTMLSMYTVNGTLMCAVDLSSEGANEGGNTVGSHSSSQIGSDEDRNGHSHVHLSSTSVSTPTCVAAVPCYEHQEGQCSSLLSPPLSSLKQVIAALTSTLLSTTKPISHMLTSTLHRTLYSLRCLVCHWTSERRSSSMEDEDDHRE
jgi:hypothetical protein